jgi:hypothetical protein
VTTVSEFVIKSFRPSLMLAHPAELDAAQHRNGLSLELRWKRPSVETGTSGRVVEATREAGIFGKTTFFIKSFRRMLALTKESRGATSANG